MFSSDLKYKGFDKYTENFGSFNNSVDHDDFKNCKKKFTIILKIIRKIIPIPTLKALG